MKKLILCAMLLSGLAIQKVSSQSANLDRERFRLSYVKLPSIPILDDQKRTYDANNNNLRLSGFSKVSSNGTLSFRYLRGNTKVGEVDIQKEKHEKKDKDGNVVSTTYTYAIHTRYSSNASIEITNTDSNNSYTRSFEESDSYVSRSFDTYSKASKYYNDNRYSIKDDYRDKHTKSFLARANSLINNSYGYVPYTTAHAHFWILSNKKHPEFQKHHEVYEKLKVIFSNMEFDQPVNTIAEEVKPIIAYFEDVITRYPGKKRKIRKVRYASYYNIAKIYDAIDQPEKSKEYAQKLIDNDYDKSDGRQFIREADRLIELFNVNQIKTRHFPVISEDLSNEPQAPVAQPVIIQEAEEAGEEHMAFLITKNNDTLQTIIAEKELLKMSADLLVKNNATNKAELINAADTKKIVLTSGDNYEVIDFKDGFSNTQGPKFVKSLFDGEKIKLFKHKKNELVFYIPSTQKATSTLSKDFAFGFQKKLSEYSGDCTDLKAKVAAKTYQNKEASLIEFCKALEACK